MSSTTRMQPFVPDQNQISRPDFIPLKLCYLCTDVPYDYKPGGFRDFPERQGWIIYGESGEPKMSKFTLRDGSDASLKLAEKVALLQAWMFVGVIAEASSIYGLKIDVEDEFISTTKEGRTVVVTALLNGLAERWIQAAAGTQEGLEDRCPRIRALCQYLEPRIFDLRDPDVKIRLFTYDEAEALFSVELAYRVLLLSLTRSGMYDTPSIRPLLKAKFFDHQLRLHLGGSRRMRKQGWCQSEIRLVSRSLNRELPYAFLAATLERHSLDHWECGDFRCNADQINENMYSSAHVDPWCSGSCESVGVDVDALCSILSRDQVPVISVSQNLDVKVVESRSFVAISHGLMDWVTLTRMKSPFASCDGSETTSLHLTEHSSLTLILNPKKHIISGSTHCVYPYTKI
ncbi:hypothetical protein K435DRAFT_714955 [Dendrothele bispora CBS 962.96]|uniref:Uncharacterized protein n=1 Tax=Dendrothele bispora (strain CBS 962.96) TaxID=1314807 RepID=A0A4S8MM37_DENBC|nr:hypothetical protein K435DRAFT_714955 [Dendrothele bispora CBS 962.96]